MTFVADARVKGKPIRQRATGVIKTLLYHGGIIDLARRVGDGGRYLPVIRYHSVSESPDYCPRSISIPPAMFEREIAYLVENYTVIRFEQAVECLREGRPFPRRGIVITFDDGYKDNVTAALPILKRYEATAMFYVAAGPTIERERFWVGWLQRAVFGASNPRAVADALDFRPQSFIGPCGIDRQSLVDSISERINSNALSMRDEILRRVENALAGPQECPDGVEFMMDANDLRTLADAGMEVGSHTVSHAVLTGLPDADAEAELRNSRSMLELALDRPVLDFAYPNGPRDPRNFDRRTMQLASAAGYRSAVTSERGAFALGADPLALPRHGVNHLLSLPEFAFKIEEHRFAPLLMG